MKKILLFALLILPFAGNSQTTFTIKGFSDKYYGKLHISDTAEVFSKGWVAVYDSKTNKQLIKLESEELAYTMHEGSVKANVVEAPYGEQSVLIHDDFNFDGIKDFALMDGQNSCYHGPSYQIYLASGNMFVHSKKFTRLAQEYCGMFEYDAKEKKISTMTKSGCCWHQFCEFVVENNIPVMVKEVEDDAFGGFPYTNRVTTRTYSNGKKVRETTESFVELEQLKESILFSFKLEKSGKTVLLLENSEMLSYLLVKPDGAVEFSYPSNNSNDNTDQVELFELTKEANGYTCSFYNGYARYTIYQYSSPEKKVGIKAVVKGKTYDLVGKPSTMVGKMSKLHGLGNVEEHN